MKVLYLVGAYPDYLSDPLYIGLSRLLGEDAIIEYPYKAVYHEPQARPWFLAQRPGRAYRRHEILGLLREHAFDLVCIASFRDDCLAAVAELHGRVPFPPTVFIDGADDAAIRHDVVSQYPIALYFKRDYVWGLRGSWFDAVARQWAFRGKRDLIDRTVPLPLGIVTDVLTTIDRPARTIDISYTGRASHRRRAQAMAILRGMRDVRVEGGVYAGPEDRKYKLIGGRLARLRAKLVDNGSAAEEDRLRKKTPQDYYREIAASKIALAIRGGGYTPSPRYYEIPALGAMLMSDRPEAVIPDDFIDGRHAVFCRPDLRDLGSLVRRYVHDDAEREAMARAGHAHVLAHHTCERRAAYFVDVCVKRL